MFWDCRGLQKLLCIKLDEINNFFTVMLLGAKYECVCGLLSGWEMRLIGTITTSIPFGLGAVMFKRILLT